MEGSTADNENARLFKIGNNVIGNDGGVALSITWDGQVSIGGVLLVGGLLRVKGINVLTTPWVSCRVTWDGSSSLTVSNSVGVHTPGVSRPEVNQYKLSFPSHPSGAVYVPQICPHNSNAIFFTKQLDAGFLIVQAGFSQELSHSFNVTIF